MPALTVLVCLAVLAKAPVVVIVGTSIQTHTRKTAMALLL